MIKPLSEFELDISFAQGFVESLIEGGNEDPKIKSAMLENIKTLADGIAFYRQKYLEAQEDYDKLLGNYNQLTALSSNYLASLAQQREQIDGLLIETQREFHKSE